MSEITPEAPVEGYTSLRELFFEMAKVFFLALVIIIPIRIFLFQPFFVQGSSMEPNFKDGEYLVISEFGYKETKLLAGLRFGGFRELHRQDTFVFRYPGNESQFFIKRLIAFPGESVAIKNNRVFLYNAEYPNGFVLDESAYLPSTVSMPDMEKVTLGEDEYFAMGDNRLFSFDSRSFGPLPKRDIIGRVLVRAWPPKHLALF